MSPASYLKRTSTLLLCGFLSMVMVSPAVAQKKERQTRQTVAMSQSVYEKLQAVQELVELEDYAGGHRGIEELQKNKRLSAYERAQLYNLDGYTYYLEENYPAAIRSYEQVMLQEGLPEGLQQSTLKTLAQLHFTVEDYQLALETVRRLMAVVPEPAADVFMLLGQAYFQMQNYSKALDPIQTAIKLFNAQGRTPRENWLLLLRVCYYELGDFPSMIGVLEQLIAYYPKDTYLLTLAGVHSELGDTKKQLALVEALYENNQLKNPAHIVNLANLYLLHDTPYKAAVLLEKEMASERIGEEVRNLRLLSQAWYSAREDRKAVAPLKRAAQISGDGELYVRLAQSYLNLENWDEAATAIERGLELGGISREDTSNIMLGMAFFNQQKFSLARRAFQSALPDKRSTRTAQQWIKYVESEIRRLEIMNQTLPVNDARKIGELEQVLKSANQ